MNNRCLLCKPCRDWDTQRAAYAAAISEARDNPREVESLQAAWNALNTDPDYKCVKASSPELKGE